MKYLFLILLIATLFKLRAQEIRNNDADHLLPQLSNAAQLRAHLKTLEALMQVDSLLILTEEKINCDSFIACCYELKGLLLMDQNNITASNSAFEKARQRMKVRYGAESSYYAKMLIPLAKTNFYLKKIDLSKKQLEEAIGILNSTNKDLLVKAKANYIQILQLLGREVEAENILLESEAVIDSTISSLSKYILYDNAKMFYSNLKLNYKAIHYYQLALEQARLLKNKVFEVYQTVQSVNLYSNVSDYEIAEKAYSEALNTILKYNGVNHYSFAYMLADYAEYLFRKRNQDDLAGPLLDSSFRLFLKLDKSNYNATVIDKILSITNYIIYQSLLKNDLSKATYYKSIADSLESNKDQVLSVDHFNSYFVKVFYSKVSGSNDYNNLLSECISNLFSEMYTALNFMSTLELEKFIAGEGTSRLNHIFFLIDEKRINEQVRKGIWELTLLSKKLQLRTKTSIKDFLFGQKDSLSLNLQLKYNEYLRSEELLSADKDNIFQYKISEIEKKVLRNEKYQRLNTNRRVSYEEFNTKLIKGELAVEFISYYIPSKSKEDVYYGALISRPNTVAPEYISLFSQEDFRRELGNTGSGINTISLSEETRGLGIKTIIRANSKMFDLTWKAILHKDSVTQKIYFSPAGILNKYNLSAIRVKHSTFMIDQYQMVQLHSTADIRKVQPYIFNNTKSILLIGGLDYGQPSNENNYWEYLKGSLEEVQEIEQIFSSSNSNVTLLKMHQAIESEVRYQLTKHPTPNIIHLATHGVFNSDKEPNLKNRNSYMELNYLVLSDANNTKDEKINTEDNHLDAQEVSNFNLSGCNLVVLSACESGTGVLTSDSEGIYGLQRGLKMAGVSNIIVSLYKVPDEPTKNLMVYFYTELIKNGNDIQSAFQKAQKTMKIKYKDVSNWAGFILIQ